MGAASHDETQHPDPADLVHERGRPSEKGDKEKHSVPLPFTTLGHPGLLRLGSCRDGDPLHQSPDSQGEQ